MMKFIRLFLDFLRANKERKKAENTLRLLSESDVTVQMIEKICREYYFHFEIERPDGTKFRFFKTTPSGEKIESGGFW